MDMDRRKQPASDESPPQPRTPRELMQRYGSAPEPGPRAALDKGHQPPPRPANQLAKIYLEPTNRCNLTCRTCIRNVWDEPLGRMSPEIFERFLDGLKRFSPLPAVFFGGLGEPMSHPRIYDMIARVKQAGAWVEMITNGTLLTEAASRRLIAAGLDLLWVSIDGATPESYADVRLGAALPQVLENLARFNQLRAHGHQPKVQLGIAYVAMRRNIADLPAVLQIGHRIKANQIFVSNVFPYTEELQDELLYRRTLKSPTYIPSPNVPHLNLPKMDANEIGGEILLQSLNSGYNVSLAGSNLGRTNDICQFIDSGSAAVGWDGRLSPCLPLLHSHASYLHRKPRLARGYAAGSLAERPLDELWYDPEHLAFRQRVQDFAFAPCAVCGGCDLSEANEEDCYGNTFPTCGGCLWAQGLVQCP